MPNQTDDQGRRPDTAAVLVFGQNRQEDLVEYLRTQLPADEIEPVIERCRIELAPSGRCI